MNAFLVPFVQTTTQIERNKLELSPYSTFYQTFEFSQPGQILMALLGYHVSMHEVSKMRRDAPTSQVELQSLLKLPRNITTNNVNPV